MFFEGLEVFVGLRGEEGLCLFLSVTCEVVNRLGLVCLVLAGFVLKLLCSHFCARCVCVCDGVYVCRCAPSRRCLLLRVYGVTAMGAVAGDARPAVVQDPPLIVVHDDPPEHACTWRA